MSQTLTTYPQWPTTLHCVKFVLDFCPALVLGTFLCQERRSIFLLAYRQTGLTGLPGGGTTTARPRIRNVRLAEQFGTLERIWPCLMAIRPQNLQSFACPVRQTTKPPQITRNIKVGYRLRMSPAGHAVQSTWLILCLLCGLLSLQCQAAHERIVAFGSGLTADAFGSEYYSEFLSTNETLPRPPYFEGRWTNGYPYVVWTAELLGVPLEDYAVVCPTQCQWCASPLVWTAFIGTAMSWAA